MRLAVLGMLAAALTAGAGAGTRAEAAGPAPRVTVIGDSVQASFGFAPAGAAPGG